MGTSAVDRTVNAAVLPSGLPAKPMTSGAGDGLSASDITVR